MYQGQLSTKSIVTGRFTQVSELLNYLEEKGEGINENLSKITKWWPIVSMGLTYRF
ncbi:MAG: hypothetical protein MRQ07_02930 [Candidatus Midichloria sp.]|nr:hypothetical protein [Candidatus Midichloria sp.]